MDVHDLMLLVRATISILILFVTHKVRHKEIAFVGKAPGNYVMLLGGGYHGQRLNKIYRGLYIYIYIYIGFYPSISNPSSFFFLIFFPF